MDDGYVLDFFNKFYIKTNDTTYVPDPLLLHVLLQDSSNIDKIIKKNKNNLAKNVHFYCLIIEKHWSLFMLKDEVLYHLNSFFMSHTNVRLKVLDLGIILYLNILLINN